MQILFQRNVQIYIPKEPSVIENALILKSVIVQSSSFRRACYLLPLSTVPVPMPTESSKLQGEFQIFLGQTNLIGTLFNASMLIICLRAQRYKNVTMYLQLRLNFKLKRLKRHAYSHGILDNSFFLFLFHNNIASFVLALAAFYFFMLLKFFVCAIFSKQNKLCL